MFLKFNFFFFLNTFQKVVLKIFRHICEGVRVMHSTAPYPLVHRDLKTSNILLKDDMSPLIMDLGKIFFYVLNLEFLNKMNK